MKPLIITIFLFLFLQAKSQHYFSIGISIGGIGYHPAATSSTTHYKQTIDKNHKFGLYGGIAMYCTWHYNDFWGIRLSQMILPYDCVGKFSGVTQIGINLTDRVIGLKNEVHQLNGTFGPMWYYRKNWIQAPNYTHDSTFCKLSKSKKWETKFIWYAGHAEYNYFYQKNQAVSVILFPGYPHLYTALAGMRFRN